MSRGPSVDEHVRRPLLDVQVPDLVERGRVDPAPERLAADPVHLRLGRVQRGDGLDARHPLDRVAGLRADRREPVLVLHDELGLHVLADRVVDRRLARPPARTVTNVTSARPIISAAAVTAVRLGLRSAFSRASRPATPRSRSSGQPTAPAIGGTSRGLSSATAMKTRIAPSAEQAERLLGRRAAEEPEQRSAAAPTISSAHDRIVRRRVGGCGGRGLLAHRGQRRHARRAAGRGEARRPSVTTVPDQQRDDHRARS